MTEKKSPKVLLADDESHIRALMKAVMKSMNVETVAEAVDGQEAIDLYKKHKPDLLLLDINMPQKNGEEVLEQIMDHYPDAFVIMLTSLADMESVEKCLELGAAHYIRKDTPIDEMKVIIKETWRGFKQG